MAYTPTDWVNVPDESNPPAGAPALSAEELDRMETGIADAHAHMAEALLAHGGTLIYVEASTVPPASPPAGLLWYQTDGVKRLLQNKGTSAAPVWEDVTRDKLVASDLVTDYVVAGLLPAVPAPKSLTATIPAGQAYVTGRRVAKDAAAQGFSANQDTYVDLDRDGVYRLSAVARGATATAVYANAIRLFMAATDASAAQVDTVTVATVVSSTAYTVRINGVDVTYTSDTSATAGEIALGLVAAINASTDPNVTPVTAATTALAANATATLTITADTPGTAFTATVGTNLTIANTTANNAAGIISVTDLRTTNPTVRGGSGSQGYVSQEYIEGLRLRWDSGSALTVESGSAYIPSLGTALDVPIAISKTALTFTASTWHYVYLFDNAGTPDFEVSTVAPATPYRGTARIKGGATPDNSRRLIGAVLSDGAATPTMRDFQQAGDAIFYRAATPGAPWRVINGVVKTTAATLLNLSSIAPPGLTREVLVMATIGIGATGVAGFGDLFFSLVSANTLRVAGLGLSATTNNQYPGTTLWTPVNPATPDIYWYNSASHGADMKTLLDVFGYRIAR